MMVARETATISVRGHEIVLHEGETRLAFGHLAVRARPDLFKPVEKPARPNYRSKRAAS
jgi:hypothetical protein